MRGVILTSMLLAGCSSWPEAGRGGLAERYPEALFPIEAGHEVGVGHALRLDIEQGARHLDVLVINGAQLCFPAAVAEAQLREARLWRELDGGLLGDCANDLQVQRERLGALERSLTAVLAEGRCRLPEQRPARRADTGEQDLAALQALLNADNQFAFGSAEVNPKYAARLTRAALALHDRPEVTLEIVGHADPIGDDAAVEGLAQRRAEAVVRHLVALGLPSTRLHWSARGASQPLVPGEAPEVRLVNRRVAITLLDHRSPPAP